MEGANMRVVRRHLAGFLVCRWGGGGSKGQLEQKWAGG